MKLPEVTDRQIERAVSVLLRSGVLMSGLIVLGGGVLYIVRHGAELPDYHVFRGQPSVDRIVTQIVTGAISVRARSIIQVGVLVLIATPIARVALSLGGFALERDRNYVVITAIVLLILLLSLITGAVQG